MFGGLGELREARCLCYLRRLQEGKELFKRNQLGLNVMFSESESLPIQAWVGGRRFGSKGYPS